MSRRQCYIRRLLRHFVARDHDEEVPHGCHRRKVSGRHNPGEQYRASRSWAEAAYPGLAYFNEVDEGGHFAAWEEPELFSGEVRAAFRGLR